jgi:NAD(P)H-hydrate epimerase
MLPPLTRQQVRNIDARAIADYGLPGIVLMENAGRGAAELLLELGIHGPVIICAGKGNNGGDGFVIARHLELHSVATSILLFCDPADLSGDAATNCRVAQAAGQSLVVLGAAPQPDDLNLLLAPADWIVDALLGTGTTGTIREPYLTAIAAINRAGKKVFAVDLPSGLDCDTGLSMGSCVRADHTATFVARKVGFDTPGASELTGEVHVIEIGVPRKLLSEIVAGR